MTKTLLSFGHGYSAQALAPILLADGWRIIATTRSPEKAAKLGETGVTPLVWPDTDMAGHISRASHLLISVAPDAEGDPVLRLLEDALAASHFDWTGYLSTTGVYGDHQGGWVDETTPLTPSTKRGTFRVEAERAWQALSQKAALNLHIFRLAGIYGPGRGPFAKVRAGTARRIIKKDQVFSRIHVADIAQVLAASIANPNPGAIYNLCDDDPAPPQDVIAKAAEMLGLSIPPDEDWDTAEMTAMARSFYSESKRVRNDRIKEELGVKLIYPSYIDGLKALLTENEG